MKKLFLGLVVFLMTGLLFSVCTHAEEKELKLINGKRLNYYFETDEFGNKNNIKLKIYINYEEIDIGRDIDFFMSADILIDFQGAWLPLRAICEYLGYSVHWDSENQAIYINDSETPLKLDTSQQESDEYPFEGTYIYVNNIKKTKAHDKYFAWLVSIDHQYWVASEIFFDILDIKYGGDMEECFIFLVEPLTEEEKKVAESLKNGENKKEKYPSGDYHVGVDIPAGEYLFISDKMEVVVFESDMKTVIDDYVVDGEGALFLSTASFDKIPDYIQEYVTKIVGYNPYRYFSPDVIAFAGEKTITLSDGMYIRLLDCVAKPLDL